MIGLLAFVGLAVAGLRGPTGQAQSPPRRSSSGGRPGSPARAARAATPPSSTSRSCRQRPRCCSPCNPLLCSSDDEIKALVRDMRQGALAKSPLVIPPEEIEQFACFWEGLPEAPGPPGSSSFVPPPSGIVMRSTKAQDWKSRLTDQFGSARNSAWMARRTSGSAKPPIPGWCAFTPDDRTLVLAGEDTLRDLIQDRQAPAPHRAWDEAWEKSAKGHVIAALETRWLRRRLAQAAPPGGPDGRPPSASSSTRSRLARESTGLCDFDAMRLAGISVDVRAVTRGDDDAKPVAETMQAVITLARNSVEGLMHDSAGRPLGEAMKSTLSRSPARFLSQAKIETSGNVVHCRRTSAIGSLRPREIVRSRGHDGASSRPPHARA